MSQPLSDQHARRLREAASRVKRLRGWVASDPSQAEQLVDALLELTALRLLGHDHAAAVADAQDALTRTNKLVAEHGAVGPFTPVDDGVRFFIATTHLASVQSGLGQWAIAGRTALALRGWTALLPHVDLTPYVGARTASWLLAAQARGAWASGDLGQANAYADAALARAREGGSAPEDAPVLVDALRLAADLRWTSGIDRDALTLSREAVQSAARLAAPALQASGRLPHGWTTRVLPTLVDTRRDLADRLVASGEIDAGLEERRQLVALLSGQAGRLGAPARDALARAWADLAGDLLAADRIAESLDTAGRAAEVAGELTASESVVGRHLGAQFLAVTALSRALVRSGETADATEALAALFDRFGSLRRPAGHEAELAWATVTRADAERAAGQRNQAEVSWREFEGLVSALRATDPAAELYAGVPAEEYARDRARRVVSRAGAGSVSWQNLSDADALAAATRAPLAVPQPILAPSDGLGDTDASVLGAPAAAGDASPASAVETPDATVEVPASTIVNPDATVQTPAATIVNPDATVQTPAFASAGTSTADTPGLSPMDSPSAGAANAGAANAGAMDAGAADAGAMDAGAMDAGAADAGAADAGAMDAGAMDAGAADAGAMDGPPTPAPEAPHPSTAAPRATPASPAIPAPASPPTPGPTTPSGPLPISEPEPAGEAQAPLEVTIGSESEAIGVPDSGPGVETRTRTGEQALPTAEELVSAAEAAHRAARATGNRRETLDSARLVVDTLRPLNEADPALWGVRMVAALEALGDATFRAGDWWGSRAPKKEAKALAKQLGL